MVPKGWLAIGGRLLTANSVGGCLWKSFCASAAVGVDFLFFDAFLRLKLDCWPGLASCLCAVVLFFFLFSWLLLLLLLS